MNKGDNEEDEREIKGASMSGRDSKLEDLECLSTSEASFDTAEQQKTEDHSLEGKKTKVKRTPFPKRLHEMLDDVERANKQNVVSWQPDGLSFKVHKTKEFESSIMPKFFNHAKFRSFQRQLYNYKFSRILEGPSKGAYFHPKFKRSDKSQLPRFVGNDKFIEGKVSREETTSGGPNPGACSGSSQQDQSSHSYSTSQFPFVRMSSALASTDILSNSNTFGVPRFLPTLGQSSRVPQLQSQLPGAQLPWNPSQSTTSLQQQSYPTQEMLNFQMISASSAQLGSTHQENSMPNPDQFYFPHTAANTSVAAARVQLPNLNLRDGTHQIEGSSLASSYDLFATTLSSDMEPTPLPEKSSVDLFKDDDEEGSDER